MSEVVGTHDQGVIIVDAQVPAVFRFSSQGELLHELGREGDGPGEYRRISGVAVLPDGRVLVRDSRRALIFFEARGELNSEWPVQGDYVGAGPLTVVGDDILVRLVAPQPLSSFWEAPHYGFARVRGPTPDVDTIFPVPEYEDDHLYWAPFHSQYHVEWLSDGSIVHGAGSSYHVEVVSAAGERLASIDGSGTRIPLHDEARREIAEHHAWLEDRGNRSAPYYPEPPAELPAFQRLLVSSGDDIWVERVAEVRGRTTRYAMDVYDQHGVALGQIPIPAGLEVRAVVGDHLWGVRRGEYDEQYVVRFRVDRGGQQSS